MTAVVAYIRVSRPRQGRSGLGLEAQREAIERFAAGKHLDLQIGPRRLAFTSETFILFFSLPNFHFHAVTAYNILRLLGGSGGRNLARWTALCRHTRRTHKRRVVAVFEWATAFCWRPNFGSE